MRDDAALRDDEATVGLMYDIHRRRQAICGKALRDLGSVQHLVADVVLRARAKDAVEDAVAAFDDPRHMEELFIRLGFELAPQLVGSLEQRHVVGMLEVGEPDDPRQAVRRAMLMKQVEALESERALSAPGEVIERGASHPADSDHDDVVPIHGPDPSRGWLNGPMSTAVESLGENRVRLTVDVSPDQVQHAVDHALS